MAKVIDITEKLSFDENPKIRIKGKEYEVNADAKVVLEIMGLLDKNDGNSPDAIMKAYTKFFGEAQRESLDKLNLSFKDLTVVIETAIFLITGEDGEGEV